MKGNNPYFDITIIGAGVVGVCFAFWLTQIYDASILIVDKEAGVAYHQSSRNTGGVHRPLLMDPSLRIGRWQEESYYLWKTLAEKSRAPWITPGRLTIATEEEDVFLIEKYYKWGLKNGIPESELRYLVGDEISVIQPHVRGVAGIISTTESMTNYGILTNRLFNMAISGGVKFGGGLVVDEVKDVDSDVRVSVRDLASNNRFDIRTRLVVNAAGGASLRIAHSMGIGLNYFDIQLRGNYWVVDDPMSASIPMNIYPVTRHGIQGIDLSYTGPHLINRHDAINGWEKELGPTAAPVLGAYAYHNFAQGIREPFRYILERPFWKKIRSLSRRDFARWGWEQWLMVRSREKIVEYLKRCIPELDERMISRRGVTGILVEFMNENGFSGEPVVLRNDKSINILYVGGATAAPAFTASTVKDIQNWGYLDGLKKRTTMAREPFWKFDLVEI